MSSHLTRKELKSDQVAETVEHGVDYVQSHQKPIIQAAVAVVVLAALGLGINWYMGQQNATRDARLAESQKLAVAPVGAAGTPDAIAFVSGEAKREAETKSFSKLLADYPGTEQGYIAEYYLATIAVADGKMDDARKKLQEVADHAGKDYASLAKFTLADIDFQENRGKDAETLLRALIDSPTDLVSKDAATLALAKGLQKSNPAEAKKLLEPLAKASGEISGTAMRILNEIPK